MKFSEKKKGVTLIELIVALGLIALISALVYTFFFSNQGRLNEVEAKSNLQYEAKVILESISKYAMEATSAKVEKESGQVKSISFDLITNDDVKIPEGVKFTLDDSKLTLTTDEGDKLLSVYVERIDAVIDEEKGSIQVELKLKSKSVTYSVKDNYVFRNSHKK